MTKIPNPSYDIEERKTNLFRSLDIGICDLFVIWCLKFVILGTKHQGRANDLCLDPKKEQVFKAI